MTEEFEEPTGYLNKPGYVKSNPLNNDSYVAKAKYAYPAFAEEIQRLYDEAKASGRPFNVSQIKIKFNDLCFYTRVLD